MVYGSWKSYWYKIWEFLIIVRKYLDYVLQGNGHERDFIGRKDVYILDVYNKYIYPKDTYAKRAISRRVELFAYTQDEEYLEKVTT